MDGTNTPARPGSARAAPADDDLLGIYQALRRGEGHERVHDGNVQALMDLATEHGDAQLRTLLAEWRSSCGDDNATPAPPAARERHGPAA